MASSTTSRKKSGLKGAGGGGGVIGVIAPPKKKVDKFPLMTYLANNCAFEDSDDPQLDTEESLKAANDQRVEDLLKLAKLTVERESKEEALNDDSARKKALEVIHSLEFARNQEDTWKVAKPGGTKEPDYGGFLHPLKRHDKEDDYFSGTRKSKPCRERKRSRSEEVVLFDDGKLVSKNNNNHQLPIKITLPPRQRVPSFGLPFTPGPPLSDADNPWMQKSGSALFSESQSNTIVAYGINNDEDQAMALAIAESIRTAKLEQAKHINMRTMYADQCTALSPPKVEEKPFERMPPDPPGTSWEEDDWDEPSFVKEKQVNHERVNTMKEKHLERSNTQSRSSLARTNHDACEELEQKIADASKMMPGVEQMSKYNDQRWELSKLPENISERARDALSHDCPSKMLEPEEHAKSLNLNVSQSKNDSDCTMKLHKNLSEDVSKTTPTYNLSSSDSRRMQTFDSGKRPAMVPLQDFEFGESTSLLEKKRPSRASIIPETFSMNQESIKQALEKMESQDQSLNVDQTAKNIKEDSGDISSNIPQKGSSKYESFVEEFQPSDQQRSLPVRLPTSMPALISAMKSFTNSTSVNENQSPASDTLVKECMTSPSEEDKKHSSSEESEEEEVDESVPSPAQHQSTRQSVQDTESAVCEGVQVGASMKCSGNTSFPSQAAVQSQQQTLLSNPLPHSSPNRAPEGLQDMTLTPADATLQQFQMLLLQQALGVSPLDLQNSQNLYGAGLNPSQLLSTEHQMNKDRVQSPNMIGSGLPGLPNALPGLSGIYNSTLASLSGNQTAGHSGSTFTNFPGNQATAPTSIPSLSITSLSNPLQGKSGSFPGLPGTLPGFPGTLPGFPGILPGFLGTLPGFPSTLPGLPGTLPGLPGSVPGLPGAFPGVFPDFSGTLPGLFPGLSSSIPCGFPGIPNDGLSGISALPNNIPGNFQNGTVPTGLPGQMNPLLAGLSSLQSNLFSQNLVPPSIPANLQGSASSLLPPGSVSSSLPKPGHIPLFTGKGRGRLSRATPSA